MNFSLNDSCLKKYKQTICHNYRTGRHAPGKMMMMLAMGLLWAVMAYSQPDMTKVAAKLAGLENSVFVDTAVRITLTDGIKLSGTMARPRQQGAFPVILMVNCYPYANNYDRKRCKAWADSGYVAIVVYPRGREYSEGAFYPFENDAADNYEIIDWVSKQPWCNGKIGMYGGSYLGFTQWAAVKKLHPALKTIVPQAAACPGIDYPHTNGIVKTQALQWLKYVRNGRHVNEREMTDPRWDVIRNNYLQKGYAFNRFDSAEGHYDSVFQRWLEHPAVDSFWQRMIPDREDFARLNIPVLTTTGYEDGDQRGALYYYRMHQQYASREAAAGHYLLIGPYGHYGAQTGNMEKQLYGYTIDSAARINMDGLVAGWFNYCLRDGSRPAFLKDRVSLFVAGENKWRYFPSVEQMNRDTLCYYLQEKSTLSAQHKPGRPVALSWETYDLAGDSITIAAGGKNLMQLVKQKQVLTFLSAPLEKDIILNGSPVVDCWLSLSAPDADVEFSWWKMDKNVGWQHLSEVCQRLSHSEDRSRRNCWAEGEVHHVRLEEAPWASTVIKKGSRLMLLVHPSATNRFQQNFGSSKDVSLQTSADGGPVTLHIYTSDNYPSRILVPVL